ncbi:unnamed protein product [Prorocentrum cordatum]|uniref:Uncharacterized protein n=1 Tax=Prorocentrum cordatum TaxID=2364126 RepID=A0ABN9SCA2_9DINO|nr:unnamed protein product [Polarella glacialis]
MMPHASWTAQSTTAWGYTAFVHDEPCSSLPSTHMYSASHCVQASERSLPTQSSLLSFPPSSWIFRTSSVLVCLSNGLMLSRRVKALKLRRSSVRLGDAGADR